MASSRRAGFSHRSTSRTLANFLQNGANERSHCNKLDTLAMHGGEQRLAFGVNEIDLAEVQDGFPAMGCGTGRLPALVKFANPEPGKAPFEFESKFVGTIV